MEKFCTDCGIKKSLDEFYNVSGSDRKRGDCKACFKEGNAKRNYKNTVPSLRRELADAPFQVALELMRENPDLLLLIANRSPLDFKRRLQVKRGNIELRIQNRRAYYYERAAKSGATKRATHAARKIAS